MLQTMFQKIKHAFTPSRVQTGIKLFLVFSLFFSLGADITFAESTTDTQAAFVDIVLIFLHFLVYLSWIVIGAMGPLLSNDLVMDPTIVPTLHLLWTIIRNLVNIVFIGVLLYMAFKTIFNFEDDTSFFKDNILKLIGAIILVNFSFLGVKLLIDVSTVATHAAFSLTSMVPQEQNKMLCKNEGDTNCGKQVYSIQYQNKLKTQSEENSKKCTDADANCKDAKKMTMSRMIFMQPYSTAASGAKDITDDQQVLLEYAKLNHMKIIPDGTKYDETDSRYTKWIADKKVNGEAKCGDTSCNIVSYLEEWRDSAMIVMTVSDGSTDPTGISNRSIVPMIAYNLTPLESFLWKDRDTQSLGTLIMEVLFSLVFSVILLIAFIAMFIVLVVRVAVLWIAIIASPLLVFIFFDFLGVKESIESAVDKVVHHAFIPAVFGVVLSLTFILIGQLNYNKVLYSTDTIYMNGGSINAGDPLFNFIFMILIVIFFWMAVFWAMRDTFAEGLVDTIKGSSQEFGGWLAKRPLYMDIIPIAQGSGGDTANTNFTNLFDHAKAGANNFMHNEEASRDALTQTINLNTKEYSTVKNAVDKKGDHTVSLDNAIRSKMTAQQMQSNPQVMDSIKSIISKNTELEKLYKNGDKDKKASIEASVINQYTDKHGSVADKKHIDGTFLNQYVKLGAAAEGKTALEGAATVIKGINKTGEADKIVKAIKAAGVNNVNKEQLTQKNLEAIQKDNTLKGRFANIKDSTALLNLLALKDLTDVEKAALKEILKK